MCVCVCFKKSKVGHQDGGTHHSKWVEVPLKEGSPAPTRASGSVSRADLSLVGRGTTLESAHPGVKGVGSHTAP